MNHPTLGSPAKFIENNDVSSLTIGETQILSRIKELEDSIKPLLRDAPQRLVEAAMSIQERAFYEEAQRRIKKLKAELNLSIYSRLKTKVAANSIPPGWVAELIQVYSRKYYAILQGLSACIECEIVVDKADKKITVFSAQETGVSEVYACQSCVIKKKTELGLDVVENLTPKPTEEQSLADKMETWGEKDWYELTYKREFPYKIEEPDLWFVKDGALIIDNPFQRKQHDADEK